MTGLIFPRHRVAFTPVSRCVLVVDVERVLGPSRDFLFQAVCHVTAEHGILCANKVARRLLEAGWGCHDFSRDGSI